MALTSEGRLYTWGPGSSGALGNGSLDNVTVPTEIDMTGVLAGKKIVQASAGFVNIMVLADDGKLYAWGDNFWASVGDGTQVTRSSPVAVDDSGVLAGKKIVQISAGDNSNNYALADDGSIFSWGYYALLGNNTAHGLGSSELITSPVAVDQSAMAGSKTVKIFAARSATYALTDNGELYGWGSQFMGGLGNGQNGNGDNGSNDVHRAVRLNATGPLAGATVVDIAGGVNYSFALLSDGTIYGWGDNVRGKLGLGPASINDPRLTPVKLGTADDFGDKKVVEIKAFYEWSFVRAADGTVYTWGLAPRDSLAMETRPGALLNRCRSMRQMLQ